MAVLLRRPLALGSGLDTSEALDTEGLKLPGAIALSTSIEVSLSGTRQDDYAPSGLDACSGINFTLSADTTVTGLAATGSAPGRLIKIVNRAINTKNLTLSARDPLSAASNRFGIASNLVLKPGEGALLDWQPSSGSDASAWRCIGTYKDDSSITTVGDIQIIFGSANSGVALTVGAEARGFARGAFVATDWRILGDQTGRAGVRLYKKSGATYDNATWTSVTGGTGGTGDDPTIAPGNINSASSNLASWSSTSFALGDVIRAVIFNNLGGQGWIGLQINGTQTVARA